jgi:hypothetical protein
MKTAMLIADRGVTITSLSVGFMARSAGQIKVVVAKPTRTTRPGYGVREIVLLKVGKDRRICPVHTLGQYLVQHRIIVV